MYFVIILNILQALEWNCRDGGSTHYLSHVFEETGRYREGSQTLANTLNDWEVNFRITGFIKYPNIMCEMNDTENPYYDGLDHFLFNKCC